jgi:hypothetical protein
MSAPHYGMFASRSAPVKFLVLRVTLQRKSNKNCPTSKDIWNKLHSVYQSQGPARKAMLLKTLILLKMKNGEDMRDHIRNFFDVVDKLEEMELCIINDLLAILLLYSIPDEYENFRIAIETQEKLPQLEALKIKLLEEYEARKRNSKENVSDAMFISKNPGRSSQPKKSEESKTERFKFACHTCGKIGHMAKDCRSKLFKPKNPKTKPTESTRKAEVVMKLHVEHDKRWCLDSGASSHMCSEKAKFQEMKTPKVQTLNLANSCSTKIVGSGTVQLSVEENLTVRLDETLYVPDLRSNLLSVAKMTEHGFEIIFRKNEAIVTNPDTGENVIVARRDKDMYYIDELSEESRVSQISMSLQEWHERFGHLNEKDLKNIIRKQKVDGIDIKADEALPVCETCVKGKQTRKPFTRSVSQSTELLELVHTDVCGPMRVNSLAGSRYFVTFIDDKSRWCEVYFMKKKSEVIEKFKEYKCLVEKKTERKIKTVRSDNGTEYTSHYLEDFLKQEGIRHELTVEYTPQQNGVAERKNRSLVETARCLMIQSGLSASFWAEAILTANHIRNRCPSRSLGGEIPFKMWTRRTPIVSYFRKFGTTAFALDKTPGKGKFDSRSKKCIFIGYSVQSKAYRLWDPEARKVIRSRDVTFTGRNQAENDFTDFIDEEIFKKNPENVIEFNVPETQKEDKQTETCDLEADGETLVEEENAEEIPVIMKRGLGRPKKVLTGKRGRPRKLFNMVEVNEEEVEPEEEENHENEELHDVAGLIEFGDPQTVSEALSSPEAADWKKAMNAEYEALKRNQTWIIVDRPQGKKTVESRWVLRTKFKKDGSVDRRKARLVAKGFTQKPGIDFNETFAPVARLGSIRLFMAIAVELGLQVHQLDFTSAYLNGEIEEEVFMEVPSDFYDILNERESRKFRGNKVCLIRKALYGLKQSGRQWYKKLDEKLKQQKLKPLNSDPCVYINKEDGNIVIVVIYVDDLMVASDNPRKLQRLKSELSKSFEMKDLGPLSFCLGIEFTQDVKKQTITMSQSKYIKETLSRFNMENCKGVTTPINPNEKLSKEMCPKTEEEKKAVEMLPYQSLVGSLMYLAVSTRPDIAHAVSMLSQFNANFGEQHWRAAKRVLRYLKNTENLGLMFKKSGQELVGYADADWGASIDDRRSYTGYVFNFANAAVSWESRKQRTVAMSSTEAEYMALSESTKEAIHLKQ